MGIPAPNILFTSDLWTRALDSYARAVHLTIKLFDDEAQAVLGPIHPTPFFQLFEETTGFDPGLFDECARRCIAQTKSRPAVVVSEFFGLTVIGTSLVLDDRTVGAAVAGYAFADFAQLSEVQRLARNSGIGFDRLWRVACEQKPTPKQRLVVNAELLQVLGDALLRENSHTLELRSLSVRLLTAQEEEHRRLARDLHDDILQRLASLQNQVAALRLAPSAPHNPADKLVNIESQVGSISDDLRDLSHNLHPSILDDLGLEIATRQLVNDFSSRTSQAARFQADDVPRKVPHNIATALYRITQEALMNAHKHADKASITVTLSGLPGELRLHVEDNGRGFDPIPNHRGLGLISMKERAQAVGGQLAIRSNPATGTRIEVIVPCSKSL